jgi:hypothetical protein
MIDVGPITAVLVCLPEWCVSNATCAGFLCNGCQLMPAAPTQGVLIFVLQLPLPVGVELELREAVLHYLFLCLILWQVVLQPLHSLHVLPDCWTR